MPWRRRSHRPRHGRSSSARCTVICGSAGNTDCPKRLSQQTHRFGQTCKETVEGCGQLSDLILAAYWQLRTFELSCADLIGNIREAAHRADDEQDEDHVGG